MPYVVKHKNKDRYLCGTKSSRADQDADGLVSMEFARIFPTKAGAKTAIRHWAEVWDNTVIDQKKLDWIRQFHDPPSDEISQMCFGSVVIDQTKLDMVEILPVEIG